MLKDISRYSLSSHKNQWGGEGSWGYLECYSEANALVRSPFTGEHLDEMGGRGRLLKCIKQSRLKKKVKEKKRKKKGVD